MTPKVYFYMVGEKTLKYRYCSECGRGPFTEEQVIKEGSLRRMGSLQIPIDLCPICEEIKMNSIRNLGRPSNLPQIDEKSVEEV